MSKQVINLDDVVENMTVIVGGREYELPGDIPIPDYIEITRLVDRMNDGGENGLHNLYSKLLELFGELNELPTRESVDGKESEPVLPIGPRQLGQLVLAIYGGAGDEEDEDARPPRRAAGTKSSSRKKTPARSRSSRS